MLPGLKNPSASGLCAAVNALLDHAVGEAPVYVQGCKP